MSFLGGVRWADLSSDTHSLSAAPPFCSGLDDDAGAPSPLPGAHSPQSNLFLGQGRKGRTHKNAPDPAEALLLQCDAAAEQSYLNPASAADLGCSNAGINLHFREAARLGCNTPVEDDMAEAADALGVYPACDSRRIACTRGGPNASANVERAEEQLDGSSQQQGGGHASIVGSRRGRGSASGVSSGCAGFKGLLASTHSVSDGTTVCNRTNWSRSSNSCPTISGTKGGEYSQHLNATQGNRRSSTEMHEGIDLERDGTSEASARKGDSDNSRTGNNDGEEHRPPSTLNAAQNEHQKPGGGEVNSPGGRRRHGQVKGCGRRKDAVARGKAAEEKENSGPDASDNWRAAPARERVDPHAAEVRHEAARKHVGETVTPGKGGHEDARASGVPEAAVSSVPGNTVSRTCASPHPDQSGKPCEATEDDGLSTTDTKQHLAPSQECVRDTQGSQEESRAVPQACDEEECVQKQQHTDVSMQDDEVKDRRRDPHLASRMMTPAKRHRAALVGGFEGTPTALLDTGGERDNAETSTEEKDGNCVSGGTGDGIENAEVVEGVSAVGECRQEGASAQPHVLAGTSVEKCGNLSGATAEVSASTLQSHGQHGPPPRKKKRGATEGSNRLSADLVTAAGANTSSGVGVAVVSGNAPSSVAGPSAQPSSGGHSVHAEHHQRRGRKSSGLGGALASAAVRGRHRPATGDAERSAETNATHGNGSSQRLSGSLVQTPECTTGAVIPSPGLLQFAAQACPLLQLPGACFATPPYIMVPVAAATPLTTARRSSSGSTVPAAALHSAAVGCGPNVTEKKLAQREQQKPTAAVGPTRQTKTPVPSPQDDEEAEQEWARRASARMKDIAVGKATEGYRNFIRIIPKDKRRAGDPATPDPKQRCSKAMFQRKLLDWRKQLHRYDGCCPPEDYGNLPDYYCGAAGAAESNNVEVVSRHCTPGECRPPAEHSDANTSSGGGKNIVPQSSVSSGSSASGSSIPTPLFATPTCHREQTAGCAAALATHPDPIEQFNRECERAWL